MENTELKYVYLLALTSNMDDDYNEKNYAFREKLTAIDRLRDTFQNVIAKYERDVSDHELETVRKELAESLAETNEESYQPTFELWTYYGFIKATVTKTEIE